MPKQYDFETDGAVVTVEALKAYNQSLRDTGLGGSFAEPITNEELDLMFQGLTAEDYTTLKPVPEGEIREWTGSLSGGE